MLSADRLLLLMSGGTRRIFVGSEHVMMHFAGEKLQKLAGDLAALKPHVGEKCCVHGLHVRIPNGQSHGVDRSTLVALDPVQHPDFFGSGKFRPQRDKALSHKVAEFLFPTGMISPSNKA